MVSGTANGSAVARVGANAFTVLLVDVGNDPQAAMLAEGVETAEQAAFLLGHGCPHQQGYLFARPMPVTEFDALLVGGVVAGRARPLVAVDRYAA